jgi:hypothetical protein
MVEHPSCIVTKVVDANIHPFPDFRWFIRLCGYGGSTCFVKTQKNFKLIAWRGRNDFSVNVKFHTVGRNLKLGLASNTSENGLPGTVYDFAFATFASELFQMLKVSVSHRCNVISAEDTDFEFIGLLESTFPGNFYAGILEVF